MQDSVYECSGYIFAETEKEKEREFELGVPVALREISCFLHGSIRQ